MDSKEQLLNTLEELSKIKLTLDQKFLDVISKSTQNSSDPNIQSLVKTTVQIGYSLVEGRRSLEKTILNTLKSANEKPVTGSMGGEKEEYTEPLSKTNNVGTILIQASSTLKSVEVPISISNYNNGESQVVEVNHSSFINMKTGEQLVSKIRVDRPKITLNPNSTETVHIIFNLNTKFKSGNQYYNTIELIGVNKRVIEVILEVTDKNDEDSKPHISFNSAG